MLRVGCLLRACLSSIVHTKHIICPLHGRARPFDADYYFDTPLACVDIVDYYTSFEPLPINATMYDWYGQACKGYATQPPVQVRLGGLRTEADGTLVSSLNGRHAADARPAAGGRCCACISVSISQQTMCVVPDSPLIHHGPQVNLEAPENMNKSGLTVSTLCAHLLPVAAYRHTDC